MITVHMEVLIAVMGLPRPYFESCHIKGAFFLHLAEVCPQICGAVYERVS